MYVNRAHRAGAYAPITSIFSMIRDKPRGLLQPDTPTPTQRRPWKLTTISASRHQIVKAATLTQDPGGVFP